MVVKTQPEVKIRENQGLVRLEGAVRLGNTEAVSCIVSPVSARLLSYLLISFYSWQESLRSCCSLLPSVHVTNNL